MLKGPHLWIRSEEKMSDEITILGHQTDVVCDNCALELYKADISLVFVPLTGFTECGRCGCGMDDDYVMWVGKKKE
jgi:hypothetical protein